MTVREFFYIGVALICLAVATFGSLMVKHNTERYTALLKQSESEKHYISEIARALVQENFNLKMYIHRLHKQGMGVDYDRI